MCNHRDETSIETAVARPVAGDSAAFAQLAEGHRDMLHRYAVRLCGDGDAAADLVQEALIAAHSKLRQLKDPARFSGWVVAILRNLHRNRCARPGLSLVSLDRMLDAGFEPWAAEPEADNDDALGVMESARSLPAKYREILVLRYIEEFSYKEIAAALDLPSTTVAPRIRYARRALIRAMEERGMDEKLSKGEEIELLPIHRASALGAKSEVERLLASGDDIECRDEALGATPLFWAVLRGRREVAEWLLDHGADVNARDDELGFTPLHLAVLVGDLNLARLLVNWGADRTALDKDGAYTPETVAGARDDQKVVAALQAKGMDVSGDPRPDSRINRMFHFRGAPNAAEPYTGEDPMPPLHKAAQSGDVEELTRLLDDGAHVNLGDYRGSTSLCYAAEVGQIETMRILLARGADLRAANDDGQMPLYGATCGGQVAAAELLLSRGADLDFPSLCIAATLGHLDMIEFLIDNGADLVPQEEWPHTALHAVPYPLGPPEKAKPTVELLLGRGMDVDAHSSCGDTPLAFAAGYGQVEFVEFLLEKGADVNHPNKDGRTPLALALAMGKKAAAEVLREHGGVE